jgi:hypothetical protein
MPLGFILPASDQSDQYSAEMAAPLKSTQKQVRENYRKLIVFI